MAFEDIANSVMHEAKNQGRHAAENDTKAAKDGYEAVQQYLKKNGLDFDLGDFVRREPWIAVAGAFAIGYVVAQIVRRGS
jgi:ElaB/YqjD/DUF883 family membrane-anchored ribosome-binding protein